MAGDAAQHAVTAHDTHAPEMDMEQHRETYEAFVALTKWSVIGIAGLLFLMLIFLV